MLKLFGAALLGACGLLLAAVSGEAAVAAEPIAALGGLSSTLVTRSLSAASVATTAAAQETRLFIAPSDVNGRPGDRAVTIAVTTGTPITVGSTDLTLLFDATSLQATAVESPLEGFTSLIDNTTGRVITASATAGAGHAVPADGALFTVSFTVPATASVGCSAVTLLDGDAAPPDDLGGPVPPIPPSAILYDSTPGRFCVAACDTCDDKDHCTSDRCDPLRGCVYTKLLSTESLGVTCSLANLEDILLEPPQPACKSKCLNGLNRRLGAVRGLIGRAMAAAKARACKRKLKSAARNAKRLERRIARLVSRGGFAPVERGVRLVTEAQQLRERARSFAAARRAACARQ
jgi:hypothetical protein